MAQDDTPKPVQIPQGATIGGGEEQAPPQTVAIPSGATLGGEPEELSPVHRGFEQGMAQALGIKPPDPSNPHSITWTDFSKQMLNNFAESAKTSFHRSQTFLGEHGYDSPPSLALTPFDMIASGIEGSADTIEQGGREAYEGYKTGDKEMMARGAGKTMTALAQVFAGAERPKGMGPSLAERAVTNAKNSLRTGVRTMTGTEIAAEDLNNAPPAAEFQPALGVTPAEVVKQADNLGVQLTRGQATKAPLARLLQAIGERSMFGAKKLAEGIDRNASAMMKAVRDYADRVDPGNNGLSAEEAGEAIRKETEQMRQAAHDAADKGYDQLGDFRDTIVNTEPIRQKWAANRIAMDVMLRNAPEAVASRINALLQKASDLGTPTEIGGETLVKPELKFGDAIKLRSFFQDMSQTLGADLPKQYQALYSELAQDLDKQTDTTSQAKGFARQWRDANKGWRDYKAKYGDRGTTFYRIMDQADPAKVAKDIVARRSVSDIKAMQGEGMTTSLQALKRQTVEEIARNRFNVGKNGLGGFSHDFLKQLFDPGELRELYIDSEIARRFNWQINPSGTSNVLMGESQITHPEPSKLGLLYGAARASMPKAAGEFLPKPPPPSGVSLSGRTALFGALSGNRKDQEQ